jgi:hypothetical protein
MDFRVASLASDGMSDIVSRVPGARRGPRPIQPLSMVTTYQPGDTEAVQAGSKWFQLSGTTCKRPSSAAWGLPSPVPEARAYGPLPLYQRGPCVSAPTGKNVPYVPYFPCFQQGQLASVHQALPGVWLLRRFQRFCKCSSTS